MSPRPRARSTAAARVLGRLRVFQGDTRGANLVEYILLVGVVALISIAAFKLFAGKIWDRAHKQGETVGTVNAGQGP